MTVPAPAERPAGQVGVGEVGSGSAPSRTSTSILPSAAARRMPSVSIPIVAGRPGQPRSGHRPRARQRGATGQQARGQAHVEGAVHVAPAEGAEEAHPLRGWPASRSRAAPTTAWPAASATRGAAERGRTTGPCARLPHASAHRPDGGGGATDPRHRGRLRAVGDVRG